jgi:hypothetical protein
MAAELVIKAGLVAGDEIAFYGSDVRYGRYLCRRLETLGCRVSSPLLGLNNGQRWIRDEISGAGVGCPSSDGLRAAGGGGDA